MLKSLYIKNFALIDDLEMTFLEGLSALTGETGAGKSIILESLYLLFGKRSDAQMIRHGETKAYVHGVFKLSHQQQSVFELPETIDVEREIDLYGRNVMKINNEVSTLSKIKEVMQAIGSIHSQNDTMNLLDKSYYLELVDQVNQKEIDQLAHTYLISRSNYLDKKKHHESLKSKKNESIEKKSFLEFQVSELKSFNLQMDEKDSLDEHIEKLKNFDKIMTQLKVAYLSLEHEGFSVDAVYEASSSLEKIKHLDPLYLDLNTRLSAAYYELDDIKSHIFQTIESFDFDQNEFDLMQERSYDLSKIEQKYQKSVNDLLIYLQEIEEELMLITDFDHYIEQSYQLVEASFEKAFAAGQKLSDLRKKLAKKLENDILSELKDLDLEKAVFKITFDQVEKNEKYLLESGLDQIEFNISLNEGEPIKALSRVASGGERARFMFALKSLYAQANHLSLMILDEIDIGISGKTAAKVATKMKKLSETIQLIVITHLPQVAAKANHHYGITKIKEKERMVTKIQMLSMEDRIEMIALMLSDEKLSHFAIEQAKMLLNK